MAEKRNKDRAATMIDERYISLIAADTQQGGGLLALGLDLLLIEAGALRLRCP